MRKHEKGASQLNLKDRKKRKRLHSDEVVRPETGDLIHGAVLKKEQLNQPTKKHKKSSLHDRD